ncbi:unnamed protein product, partial [Oppiella nova]
MHTMSDTLKPIVGVCMDMCPPNELKWREEKGLLHEFEMTADTEWIHIFRETSFRSRAKQTQEY